LLTLIQKLAHLCLKPLIALFDFPIVPAELTTLVNKLFEYIQAGTGILPVSVAMELIPVADPAPSGVVTASDWASVITAMTSQISVSTVVGVLATLVTAGIGLVFLWWGVRKAVGSLMGSFRSGRIRKARSKRINRDIAHSEREKNKPASGILRFNPLKAFIVLTK
jgi:hypothetical protein